VFVVPTGSSSKRLAGSFAASVVFAPLSALREAVMSHGDIVPVVQGDVKVSLALKIRVAEEV
jgi:hypothetical protein